MKRVLCPELPKPGHPVTLSEGESNHLTHVLRLRDGDLVEAIDGAGTAMMVALRIRGGIASIEFSSAEAVRKVTGKEMLPVILEIAALKGDAMEWAVEKAVELGVDTLIPLLTAHTVLQVDRKGPEAFQERWQKIADQALKQCGRLNRMTVKLPVSLEEAFRDAQPLDDFPRLWCDEKAKDTTPELLTYLERARTMGAALNGVRLLIGPEGGWSDTERGLLSASGTPISLGPLVLRAETAAIFSASVATSFFRKI